MTYQCSVETVETQPAVSIRSRTTVAQLPQLLSKTYQTLFQYLAENNAHVARPPFAAYYDMDMQNRDIEIGLPINRSLPGKGDIKSNPPTARLMQWMGQNQHTATGVAYEIYLGDPQNTPAAKLCTLIAMRLR